MSVNQKFELLKTEMFDVFFKQNPHYASFFGLHDPYDYLLPKGDTAHVFNNMKLLEDSAEHMKQSIEYSSLNDTNQIDWYVLIHASNLAKFDFYERGMHERNPDAFEEIGSIFFSMITKDYAPLEKRIQGMIARIKQLPDYLHEFQTRFRNSKPVTLWTNLAIESATQIPGLFQFIIKATKNKISPELHTQLINVINNFSEPLKKHMLWLDNLKSKTIDDWALGKEKFEELLQLRGLGMTADEVHQLGIQYLQELKEERTRLATQIAPEKSVENVLKTIKAKVPKTFEEALDITRKEMENAKQFLIKNNLVTIYEDDKLLVEETPSFLAPLFPSAGLFMPSRFDKPMIGIYIVTRPKDLSNLSNHLNFANIRNTAIHEAFPGHFLQGTISNRSSLIHNLAGGTETVEGWAHYCEQMMIEKGYISSLESKMIQVNAGIWRALRIIVDVQLSCGEMSFDNAVNMLIKEVSMSQEVAIAEVRRYTQNPGYPLSYLIGKHLILQLREDVKQTMETRYDERFFHDTITANGYLPISLLRRVFKQKIGEFV